MKSIIKTFGSLFTLTIPTAFIISCGSLKSSNKNESFNAKIGWKNLNSDKRDILKYGEFQQNIDDAEYQYQLVNIESPMSALSGGDDVLLSKDSYNHVYKEMKKYPDSVAMVVIANYKVYVDIIKMKLNDKVEDIFRRSDIEIKMHDPGANMGMWMSTYRLKADLDQSWKHGTRHEKNYNDYYPLYYINHKYSQFGVTNWKVSKYEVYEVTYDIK